MGNWQEQVNGGCVCLACRAAVERRWWRRTTASRLLDLPRQPSRYGELLRLPGTQCSVVFWAK